MGNQIEGEIRRIHGEDVVIVQKPRTFQERYRYNRDRSRARLAAWRAEIERKSAGRPRYPWYVQVWAAMAIIPLTVIMILLLGLLVLVVWLTIGVVFGK